MKLNKQVKVVKLIQYMRQEIIKNKLIVKFHPRISVYTFFSFFHSRVKSHPCLFDRDEFIQAKPCKQQETLHHRQERVSSQDEIPCINTRQ